MRRVTLERAQELPGLRAVLLPGVPSPWGEATKGILHLKGLDYARVDFAPGSPADVLEAWTGQTSLPVVAWEKETPRTGWAEIWQLAERLAPDPPLVPDDPAGRAQAFGLANECMGEDGLCWNLRLRMVHDALSESPRGPMPAAVAGPFGARYGYTPEAGERALGRACAQLAHLADVLVRQKEKGSDFYVGDRLSAVDVYSAVSVALLRPLPHDACPMPEFFRRLYSNADPEALAAAAPILFEHRDRVYERYLELPMPL